MNDVIVSSKMNPPMLSLHSHSGEFCFHGHGLLEDVILKAIEMKFTLYGLSEHMYDGRNRRPRTRKIDLYPEEIEFEPIYTDDQFERYYLSARRLQKKYQDRIKLLVGMEIEWIHAGTYGELIALRERFKLDYLVGYVLV